MRLITSLRAMERLAQSWRRQGARVGFVPTMGSLHEGHLSLARRARQLVGRRGIVVVSIYVNPTQFGPREDFKKYPRQLKRDLILCRQAGVNAVFAPTDEQMYPGGLAGAAGPEAFSTYIVEETLSRGMEGRSRPGHFRGVTTVVAKLFNLVLPAVAVFGAKDWQQAAVIQRMVRDLNFPLKIVVAPTVREADGLAMSSRNKYLQGDLRRQAPVLWHAIRRAQTKVRRTERGVRAASLRSQLKRFLERQPDARVDYIEFFDPATLQPVTTVRRGTHLAVAAYVGRTRLIDNAPLR
jgi:pantoate--beta-alanine ligase